jgi:exosome complex RNA-binding protein Rrp4
MCQPFEQYIRDRVVTIIEDGDWEFKMDNFLPHKLYAGQKIEIKKFVWHRVIKGKGNLIVEIEEL